MSKTKEYLKSIGVPAATINALEKADADEKSELDVTTYADEFKSHQRKLMENDPELVAAISDKAVGTRMGKAEQYVKKKFGLSGIEGVGSKKFEELIDMGYEEAKKGTNKDLKVLEDENINLKAKIKELEETEIPKIKEDVEREKKAFHVNNKLQKKIPVADLRVPMETVDLILGSQLNQKYDLDLDDKGEFVIYNKGQKLQAKSSDGTKLLTIDDIIGDILKTNKLIKESNADDVDPAGKKKEVQPTDEEKKKLEAKLNASPHLKKALEHAEELKKQREATTGTK